MIIWLLQKNRVSVEHYSNQVWINLAGVQVYLCCEENAVRVTASNVLHFTKSPIPYGVPVSFINRTVDLQGMIIVEKGCMDLHPYIRKQHMVINDTAQADLMIPSGTGYLYIDEDHVTGMHLQFPLAHCGRVVQSCTISTHECIVFYPYVIWFEKDFVLIHGPDNRLPIFHPIGRVLPSFTEKKQVDGYQPQIRMTMSLQLPEPMRVSVLSSSSFMRMLPSFLMAIASVSVAGINGIRMVETGKGILDVLPVLLVPCAMLVSSLVVTPVLSLFEKRRVDTERNEVIYQYGKALEKTEDTIQSFIHEYETSIAFLENTEVSIHQSMHSLYVLFPMTDDCLQFTLTRRWNSNIKETEEMADAFIESIQPIRQRLALDLMLYPSILLCGSRVIQGLRYLCQCIVSHSRIPMAVLMEPGKEDLFWLRYLDNIHENGKRNIFHEVSGIQAFSTSHQVCLCLILTTDQFSVSNGTICISVRQDAHRISCDLLIDCSDLITIHDYRQNRQWQMSYDDSFERTVSSDDVCHTGISSSAMNADFLSVAGVSRVQDLCIRHNHTENRAGRGLIAVIGLDENGNQITLNMHEKQDGPHGIVAGMTGSGKSELLLTLVLSLACRYSPQQVQFAFVDFKGGGLADQLKTLPHTAGVLSNLDELHFDKALSSFTRICTTRQQLLLEGSRRSGRPITNIIEYRNSYECYSDLPYPSDLIIVIDEFAELRKKCSEYMRDLITLARIGRSFGIHLILCTQKPSGNINEEILSNCSFRIVLKVADRKDSQEILGTPQAADLNRPGQFVLYTSAGFLKGQAGYANARLSKDGIVVETVDMDGGILDSSMKYVPLQEPQLGMVLQEIKDVCNIQAQPLWTPSISPQLMENSDEDVFSMWDDIPQNMHHKCSVKEGSWLFSVRITQEKESLIHTLLYCALHTGKDVIVTGYRSNILEKAGCISVIQDDQIDEMMEKLKTSDCHQLIWICCELPYRKNEHMERRYILDALLERKNISGIQVMLVVQDASMVSLSSMHSFDHVVAIRETSRNVLFSLFETGSRPCRNEDGFGLIKVDRNVHEWCYRSVTDDELIAAIQSSTHVPSFTIGLPPCQTGRIPLGMGRKQWLYADSHDRLIIASNYDNPLYEISKKLEGLCMCQYGYHDQGHGIFLCDTDTARAYKYKIPILLLDSGSVYGFASNLKIHEGQALLFADRHSEVITLVNPKEYSSVCPPCSAESDV